MLICVGMLITFIRTSYRYYYSSVPNKRAGSNKQAGRIFYENLIIEQALINKQGGKNC